MSLILSSKNFGDKLYNSLPELYRTYDKLVSETEPPLYRYLQSLSGGQVTITEEVDEEGNKRTIITEDELEGAFQCLIDEINGLLNLVDADKIKADWLPILFKAYGLEMFYGVPETYLRKLFPMVSELFTRKGSISSVEYITSMISGVRVSIDDSKLRSSLSIRILLEMDYAVIDSGQELPDLVMLGRIIKEFLPFYLDASFVYLYVFYEKAELFVYEDDELRIRYNYLDKVDFDVIDVTLINKKNRYVSDNFILDDIDPEFSPNAHDYTINEISGTLLNSRQGMRKTLGAKKKNVVSNNPYSMITSAPIVLNDSYLYDKIYVNGELVEEIEY